MGTTVFWLFQAAADVPATDYWLTSDETDVMSTLQFEKRRSEWRLGRWTAKQALISCMANRGIEVPNQDIEIRSASDGAPDAFIKGNPASLNLSISHREDLGLCAVCARPALLGCDIEIIERRSARFIADYFTTSERNFIHLVDPTDHDVYTNLIWSAKECALKALREGLRLDTRSVEVSIPTMPGKQGWFPFSVRYVKNYRTFKGWWRRHGSYLISLASDPPPDVPHTLMK